MITTLILGAGMSATYGYPTGPELLTRIKERLSANSSEANKKLRKRLERECVASVDEFIAQTDTNTATTLKHIVAEIIYEHEVESNLYRDGGTGPYAKIFRELFTDESGKFDVTRAKNFRIITFNYDRSLEFFLSQAIMSKIGCSAEEAFEHLKPLHITHIHGRLANLPGEPAADEYPRGLPYGAAREHLGTLGQLRSKGPNTPNDYLILEKHAMPLWNQSAASLKGCFENKAMNAQAKAMIEEAERVLFFGFGFNHSNMEALGYPFDRYTKQKVKKRFVSTWYQADPHLRHGGVQFREVMNKYGMIRLVPDTTCTAMLERHVSLKDHSLDKYD